MTAGERVAATVAAGPVTVTEAADLLGVGRERARQLLEEAVAAGAAARLAGKPARYTTVPGPPVGLPSVMEVQGVLGQVAERAVILERRVRAAGTVTGRDVQAIDLLAATLTAISAGFREASAEAA